jgi:hypothetical protein
MPANPDFDDIVSATMKNRARKAIDNATSTTAGLDRARRKGKVKTLGGGSTIVRPLEVALNPHGGWYDGGDPLDVSAFEPFSAAEYAWKNAYVSCTWFGPEKRKNSGKEQMFNLILGRIKNSERSLYELVAQAFYSDGTGDGGKQMAGTNLLVAVDPTQGSVGGIPRADNVWWQNQIEAVDFDAAVNYLTANPSPFVSAMNKLAIECVRGTDRPDLWLFDAIGYGNYLSSLQPMQQVSNTEVAGHGFTNLKYFGAGQSSDVVLDNGFCPTKTGFALNTDYLYLEVHEDMDFAPIGGERMPINQDATVRLYGFMGNLTLSNAARQGRLNDN